MLRKKARSRSATHEDKENYLNSIRMYKYLLKKKHEKIEEGNVRKHENAYRKNFYKFAKDACNGELDTETVQPKFTAEEAYRF